MKWTSLCKPLKSATMSACSTWPRFTSLQLLSQRLALATLCPKTRRAASSAFLSCTWVLLNFHFFFFPSELFFVDNDDWRWWIINGPRLQLLCSGLLITGMAIHWANSRPMTSHRATAALWLVIWLVMITGMAIHWATAIPVIMTRHMTSHRAAVALWLVIERLFAQCIAIPVINRPAHKSWRRGPWTTGATSAAFLHVHGCFCISFQFQFQFQFHCQS